MGSSAPMWVAYYLIGGGRGRESGVAEWEEEEGGDNDYTVLLFSSSILNTRW